MNQKFTTFVGKVIGSKLSLQSNNWSHIYIYEPAIERVAATRGNLYLVLDLPASYEPLGRQIIDDVRKLYYDELSEDPLQSLEAALGRANQRIEEFGNRLLTSNHESLRRIHLSCMVLVGQDLHLAQVGDIQIYLVRKGRLNKISNTGPQSKTGNQAFQNIASGKIEIGDILTVSTPKLFEIVPIAQFKEIVTTCYPSVAGSRISEQISKNKRGLDNSPSALILEVNAETVAQMEGTAAPAADPRHESLDNRVKDSKDQIAAQMYADTHENEPAAPLPADASPDDGMTPPIYDEATPANTGSRMETLTGIIGGIGSFFGGVVDFVRGGMDPAQRGKIALIIGIAILLLVGYNVMRTRQEGNPSVQSSHAYAEAFENYTQAREYLRGNDFVNARSYFLVAQTKAEEAIAQNSNQDRAQTLISDIQKELDNIDGVTRLSDLEVVADVSTEAGVASKILPTVNGFYLFDLEEQRLFRLTEDNGQLSLLADPILENRRVQLAASVDDDVYFYSQLGSDDKAVYTYTATSDAVEAAELSFETPFKTTKVLENWTDATGNMRLYALGTGTDSGLWRYRITGGRLTTPQDVINPDTARPEFETIVDFSIDGDVYLLTQGGMILKYVGGNLDTEFKLKGLKVELAEPVALTSATRLPTSPAGVGQKLYVADRGNNRVLIFNKEDGQLTKILAAENAFTDLRDLHVDEENNQLYVLDGAKVYKIQL